MSVNKILKELEVLIAPTKETKCISLEEVLLKKLNESCADEILEQLKILENSLPQKNPFRDEQWWRFLSLLMQKLLDLKTSLLSADEKDSLISLNQQKTMKSSLQILISLGISAHLSPGIGISLEKRSSVYNQALPRMDSLQKTFCLNMIIRCVMSLREEQTFRNLIVSSHIGDCLAAIFQLILNNDSLNTDPNYKSYLEKQLSCILEETFQPVLMRELMLMNGNKDCPAKLARALRLIMVETLMKENGVISTCKAILDIAGDQNSPRHWATVSSIAKLISTPHQSKAQNYRDKVYPQINKLLSSNEVQYAQIAVLCVRTVHETDPELCQKCFIDEICSPLVMTSTEEKLNYCIESLYNCIGIPSSHHWALPTSLFKNIYVPLFRLFCFVVNSASHIKNKVKQIVLYILFKDMDYDGFVFGSVKLKFKFGEQGGVFTELSSEEEITPWGDATDVLLNLIEDDDMKVKLFNAVIPSLEGTLEKRVVAARILSELCTDSAVLKWIEEQPSGIVNLIKSLLENDYENEITCLGLMVLSIMLNSDQNMKDRDWSLFDALVEPLKKFKSKTDNVELRVLSDDLYCTILTRGVIKKESINETVPLNRKKTKVGQCEQALLDVIDPLLPIRAHALRELGKLIISKDPEAQKNKERIYCIFKENLKCDDSYVYLSAVEGMSSFTGMYPDEVLVTLTEQFVHCKVSETRLKVGEVLMRVIRILGEMAAVYKNEIINALLYGCRDSDHIVRASSLSNLGELCRILSFRIHAFMMEIFECIRSIFETDKAMEPRRAAVMLLALLLKGLGTDALQVLEPILLNIYRLLKHIYNHDKDDITKLHAQLAIEELNSSTIMFLCPPQDLKKHIFVLHPPS